MFRVYSRRRPRQPRSAALFGGVTFNRILPRPVLRHNNSDPCHWIRRPWDKRRCRRQLAKYLPLLEPFQPTGIEVTAFLMCTNQAAVVTLSRFGTKKMAVDGAAHGPSIFLSSVSWQHTEWKRSFPLS